MAYVSSPSSLLKLLPLQLLRSAQLEQRYTGGITSCVSVEIQIACNTASNVGRMVENGILSVVKKKRIDAAYDDAHLGECRLCLVNPQKHEASECTVSIYFRLAFAFNLTLDLVPCSSRPALLQAA